MPNTDRSPSEKSADRLSDFFLSEDNANASWLDRIRQAEKNDTLGTIGDYELLEEIGRGGQGIVYRAIQPGTGRIIALKRMLAGSFASGAARRRFEREVETASSVNHPGIVTVYGIEHVDGQPLLAMEWIDGSPINQGVHTGDSRSTTPRDIVASMMAVCDAVAHAHRHGIIHRDLKPSNILVDKKGQPHILDFGLAKLIDSDTKLASITRSEQFVGTPAYAAPEQIRANEKTADVRTDVYALGIILHEMLTGSLPYDTSGNLPDAFHAIEHDEPTKLSQASGPIDHDLELIVLKSLRKAKSERYQSVDAYREDLQRYLDGEPVIAHPPTTIYQIRKLVRRYRIPFVFAAVLSVLIISFAIIVSIQASRIADQRDKAIIAQSLEAEARQAAEMEKTRAQRESANALAISDFLKDMLSSVEPEKDGHDVRVADVLAQASQSLGDNFEGQWETAVTLHQTISDTYRTLGMFDEAEQELNAAINIQQSELGPNDLRIIKSQHKLASLYIRQSRFNEAEVILKSVIEQTRTQLGQEHEQVGIALQELAEMHRGRSDYTAAMTVIEESIEILSMPGVDESHLLASQNARANLLADTGRYVEAESMFREVLSRQMDLHGNDHPLVMATKENLALVVAKDLGRPEEGVVLYREIVAYARRTQGSKHPETALKISSLAGCLQAMGAYEEAEPLYREAIDIYRDVYDEPHPDLGIGLNNLGHYLRTMKRFDEAEPYFIEAVDVMRKSLGEDHIYTSIIIQNYGEFLYTLKRFDEAETLIRSALTIREKRLPPDHVYLGDTLSVLGKILLERKDYEAAEPALRRCAEIRAVALPNGHWRIPDSRSFHGGCLTQLGRFEQAEPILLQAYEALKVAPHANDFSRNGALERIISLYDAWGPGHKLQAQQWRELLPSHPR